MIKFIRTYQDLILALPFLCLLGNLFAPLCYVVVVLLLVFWTIKKKHDHIIIFLLLTLVMGDSRMWYFLFVKNLRVITISYMAILTILGLIKKQYSVEPIFLLCIPFFISASISGLRSPEIVFSYSKLISYFLLLLVVFHYLNFHIKRLGEKLAIDILGFASWIYLIGLLMIFLNPSFSFLQDRYRGMLGNPNGLGSYCFFIFAYSICLWHIYPHRRGMITKLMILLGISIVLSGSRNAIASIVLFLLVYKLYLGKPVRRVLFWFFIVPVIITFFQLVSIEDLVNLVGLGEYLRVESISTGTGRYLAWTIGWEYIQESLWLGGGFAYEEIMFLRLREFLITTEHQGGLHNSYLTLIMNTGLIGLVLWLTFFVFTFRKMKPAFLANAFLISALVSANFESWMMASLNAFTIHFFLVVVTLSNYYRLKNPPKT